KLLRDITNAIYLRVLNNFIKTGLPEGLSCELRIKLVPGGKVVGVSIINSSGNDIFDRRAVTAVEKSSPLPVPDDAETLDRLDLRDIKFTFKPRDY
ncbi:MAG TPA: cell envelope integrity protein TolA, partial [Gammaproteobacteria bacterium]|nr:cell envelope integrity protein TolA [Gammaproteobacteria bacterium]